MVRIPIETLVAFVQQTYPIENEADAQAFVMQNYDAVIRAYNDYHFGS